MSWSAPSSDGGLAISTYRATATPGGASCATTRSVARGPALNCTISALGNGTSYSVSVVARNAMGSSAASASSGVTTATIPTRPPTPTISVGGTLATVSWGTTTSAGGAPITSYRAVATPGGASCKTSGPQVGQTSQSCIVHGLQPGTTYTFVVTATNAVGTSAPSSPSPGVTTLSRPSAPTDVTVGVGLESLSVSWLPSTSDGGAPMTTYVATALPGGQQCVTPVTVPEADACTITGLEGGQSYSVTVVGTNSAFRSSRASVPVVGVPEGPPHAPTNVSWIDASTVAWSPPANDGASPISAYVATATDADGNSVGTCTYDVPTGGDSSTDSCSFGPFEPVPTRLPVSVSITAENGIGLWGPASQPVGQMAASVTTVVDTTATFAWSTPSPASGDVQIDRYAISIALASGSTTPSGTWACKVAEGHADGCTVTPPMDSTGLEPSTSYVATINAVDQLGVVRSTQQIAFSTGPGPVAPSNITVGQLNHQLAVSWDSQADASVYPASYHVTATDPSGHVAGTCSSDAAADACTINGLTNGVTYTIDVVTTDVNGGSGTPGTTTSFPEGEPGPPTKVRWVGSAEIQWSPPTNTGGVAMDNYTAFVFDANGAVGSCSYVVPPGGENSTVDSCTVVGLNPSTLVEPVLAQVVGTNVLGDTNTTTEYPVARMDARVSSVVGTTVTFGWFTPDYRDAFAPIDKYVISIASPLAPDQPVMTTTCIAWEGNNDGCTVTSPPGPNSLLPSTSYVATITSEEIDGTIRGIDQLSFTTGAGPIAPSNVRATPSNDQLAISWDSQADASVYPASYHVTATDPSGHVAGTCSSVVPTDGSPATNACTITGLTNGVTYTISVVTTDIDGNSGAPRTVTASSGPGPVAPSNITVGQLNHQLAVSWDSQADASVYPASYHVTATDPSGHVAGTCSSDAAADACTINGLTNGVTYTIDVVTTDVNGGSGTPGTTTSFPEGEPGPPTKVRWVGSAEIQWSPPTNTGGVAMDNYTAFVFDANGAVGSCSYVVPPGGENSTVDSCTVVGLNPSTLVEPVLAQVVGTNVLGDTNTTTEYPVARMDARVSSVVGTTVTFGWFTPDYRDAFAPIDKYVISIASPLAPDQPVMTTTCIAWEGNNDGCTVTSPPGPNSLLPSTSYVATITSEEIDGTIRGIDQLSFTTGG